MLIVIDDDPTGTQSVSDLPVLTRWTQADLAWAATNSPAVYLQTNSRSLSQRDASAITGDAAAAALEAFGHDAVLVSRSDSTLRGHFPTETDALITQSAAMGTAVDAIVLAPAFPQAGRITVDGIHYLVADGKHTPAAQSEFAADPTFGYCSSDLREWVTEKSGGRYTTHDVEIFRRNTTFEELMMAADQKRIIVVDAETDEDLSRAAAMLRAAEAAGKRFVYRVGPPFVRAMLGRPSPTTVDLNRLALSPSHATGGGLIVVGSHVDVTARQLKILRENHPNLPVVELDVKAITSSGVCEVVGATASKLRSAIISGDAILQTTRTLRRGDSPEESLRLARLVSDAVSATVKQSLRGLRPKFVIAKGGITSSDVAKHGLDVTRATILGPMLPGIIALWRIETGPMAGTPYIVFPGNVGDSAALNTVYKQLAQLT